MDDFEAQSSLHSDIAEATMHHTRFGDLVRVFNQLKERYGVDNLAYVPDELFEDNPSFCVAAALLEVFGTLLQVENIVDLYGNSPVETRARDVAEYVTRWYKHLLESPDEAPIEHVVKLCQSLWKIEPKATAREAVARIWTQSLPQPHIAQFYAAFPGNTILLLTALYKLPQTSATQEALTLARLPKTAAEAVVGHYRKPPGQTISDKLAERRLNFMAQPSQEKPADKHTGLSHASRSRQYQGKRGKAARTIDIDIKLASERHHGTYSVLLRAFRDIQAQYADATPTRMTMADILDANPSFCIAAAFVQVFHIKLETTEIARLFRQQPKPRDIAEYVKRWHADTGSSDLSPVLELCSTLLIAAADDATVEAVARIWTESLDVASVPAFFRAFQQAFAGTRYNSALAAALHTLPPTVATRAALTILENKAKAKPVAMTDTLQRRRETWHEQPTARRFDQSRAARNYDAKRGKAVLDDDEFAAVFGKLSM